LRRGLAALGVTAVLSGCTWLVPNPLSPPVTQRTLDVSRGTIDGIALGDTVADVIRVLGEPEARGGPAWPADEGPGFHGPWAIGLPPGSSGPPDVLRYAGVGFVAANNRIFAIVGGSGVTTSEGAVVGQGLATAMRAHPGLWCERRRAGEPIWPQTTPSTYQECTLVVDGRRLVIAGDPIASISLIEEPPSNDD
jgi:hypothetical protein